MKEIEQMRDEGTPVDMMAVRTATARYVFEGMGCGWG
jgi:hypothetical protein